MTNCWCETTVGGDTFKILMWDWTIRYGMLVNDCGDSIGSRRAKIALGARAVRRAFSIPVAFRPSHWKKPFQYLSLSGGWPDWDARKDIVRSITGLTYKKTFGSCIASCEEQDAFPRYYDKSA